MEDNKNIDMNPEVKDEELDDIAGGGSFSYQKSKKCPTPGCNTMVPWYWEGPCPNCQGKADKPTR